MFCNYTGLFTTVKFHEPTMLACVPAVTFVPIEDEVTVNVAREGFETDVTVKTLPFNGNEPLEVIAVLLPLNAVTSEAARKGEARGVTRSKTASNVDRKRKRLCLACRNRQYQTRRS